MNFFDDCDKILKIHYDFYFKGLFDENNEAIWKNLDKFFEISKQNLTIKDYGYIQAVHSQLTTDGYLAPIGRLHNLTKKTHRVTPRGFAFVINGGYRKQVKDEKEKIRLNRINSFGSTLGWIVAAIFGGLQFYQGTKNNDEITTLKKDMRGVLLLVDSVQKQQHQFQLPTPKQNPTAKTLR